MQFEDMTGGGSFAFDRETALDGAGELVLEPAWNIADNPNGGYLGAITLRAMRDLAGHPDPLSFTTHYLRPGSGGRPARVEADLVRSGRTTSSTAATLVQDGRDRIRSIAVFGDLAEVPTAADATLEPPPIPRPEECIGRTGDAQGVDLPILDRVQVRLHPDQAPSADPDVPRLGRAEVSGWVRFADGRPPDTLALALFADVFPPPLYNLLGPVGWVPTVELTVHVRRRPADGWILADFAVRDLVDGRFIEDGRLWDESGALVARSRQLGLLLGAEGDG